MNRITTPAMQYINTCASLMYLLNTGCSNTGRVSNKWRKNMVVLMALFVLAAFR